jgi:tripartite-type tricarboxylate transporter receptor subunit TctC
VFHFWRGVLVPKGTPADRVATLSEGFGKLVKDEGFLSLIKAINSNIAYLGHTTFAEYLTGEQKQLKELYETMKK